MATAFEKLAEQTQLAQAGLKLMLNDLDLRQILDASGYFVEEKLEVLEAELRITHVNQLRCKVLVEDFEGEENESFIWVNVVDGELRAEF